MRTYTEDKNYHREEQKEINKGKSRLLRGLLSLGPGFPLGTEVGVGWA